MLETPLSKHAGPIALVAGALFALMHVGQFLTMDDSDPVAMAANPAFQFFGAAYFIAFPLMLISLVGLYLRQDDRAGPFGAIAFCAALTGTVALAGDMWFEGFAMPWIAPRAPQLFDADRDGLLLAAWLISVALFALGWILFAIASWRAQTLPRAMSIALTVGGLVGFLAAMPPWGVVLGLVIATIGGWLIRQDRTANADTTRTPGQPVTVAAPQ
jgi:hypothetical protein